MRVVFRYGAGTAPGTANNYRPADVAFPAIP